jgi:hypothetical protein
LNILRAEARYKRFKNTLQELKLSISHSVNDTLQ